MTPGDKYISVRQAAALLGVSYRTIYRYAKRGVFRTRCEGRSVRILEEDLNLAKKGRHDAIYSPVKKDIITILQAEVQTLKMQMATVMRILNVRYEPLKFTIPEYLRLYQSAEQLSTEGWAPHAEEMWAEYFVRLTVEDLEAIELASEDKHPWRPLLRLATTMHLNPYNKQLTDMFAAGRTHVQHIAGVWCVLREESPRAFDLLLERDTTPIKKLVRRLQRVQ